MGHCTIFESGKKTRDFAISPIYWILRQNTLSQTSLETCALARVLDPQRARIQILSLVLLLYHL
jgi:hypothetical protein